MMELPVDRFDLSDDWQSIEAQFDVEGLIVFCALA